MRVVVEDRREERRPSAKGGVGKKRELSLAPRREKTTEIGTAHGEGAAQQRRQNRAYPFWNVSTLNPTVGVVAMGAADCVLAIFRRLMIVVFPLLSKPTTSTDTWNARRKATLGPSVRLLALQAGE